MILDIWNSFRSLPIWVQIWVGIILVPVNMLALAFLSAPGGILIASLAVGGMAPNALLMLWERGLSKAMAFPHLVIWTPLLFVVGLMLIGAELTPGYRWFLMVLFATDAVSLAFDYPDALRWVRGERKVARP
ncbi:MAG: hypothetical protein GY952_15225 [Rhodobacteraceae bacterium]|nr:hypothetical protein [Paracoccaceae bacterium]